jgi:hypothetical protein
MEEDVFPKLGLVAEFRYLPLLQLLVRTGPQGRSNHVSGRRAPPAAKNRGMV